MSIERLAPTHDTDEHVAENHRSFNPDIGTIMRANLKNPSEEDVTKIASII